MELGGAGHDVRNNVFAFNGAYGLDARSATGMTEDYNLYFSNTKGACAGCTPGPHAVASDPLLQASAPTLTFVSGKLIVVFA